MLLGRIRLLQRNWTAATIVIFHQAEQAKVGELAYLAVTTALRSSAMTGRLANRTSVKK